MSDYFELVKTNRQADIGELEWAYETYGLLLNHCIARLSEGSHVSLEMKRIMAPHTVKQRNFFRGIIVSQLVIGFDDLMGDQLGVHVDKDGTVRPVPINNDQIHLYMKREFAKMHKSDFPNWNHDIPFSMRDLDIGWMMRLIDFAKAFAFENNIILRTR